MRLEEAALILRFHDTTEKHPRLLRDLPMGFGGVDAIPPKERDRDGCVTAARREPPQSKVAMNLFSGPSST